MRPFTDKQIELLKTFADQAVIAIENTRLFNELESRNRDLTESLEQQTATSEILRVISQSQTDVQPVFDAIAVNARKLCDATFGVVFTFDGELIKHAASDSLSSEALAAVQRTYPMPPNRGSAAARAILTRTVINIPDVREDPEYRSQSIAEAAGYRSTLSVPMLRDGSPIGTINVAGARAAMFSERQIAMLQTFADQAVIAIENTRLFEALESRNRDLTEALEQQTATSEILRVISQSQSDVQPVFDTIAANARKLCDGTSGWVVTFDGELMRIAAADSASPAALDALRGLYPLEPSRGITTGRAILTRATVHIADFHTDPEYSLASWNDAVGFRSGIAVPMLRDGKPVGAINVVGVIPGMFSERQIAMLQTFADQAVIAIENTRLFNELQTRNRDLTEALEQQTATSEILRVISSSPTDLQPVLDAVAESAARLCDANDATIFRVDGDAFRTAAHFGSIPTSSVDDRIPLLRDIVTGRAILDRSVLHIADVLAESDSDFAGSKAYAARFGYRTMLAVPMLREGAAIGTIAIRRAEVRPFSDKQIELLKTFADQAVIAIENTRLFTELQRKNDWSSRPPLARSCG